MNWKPLYTEHLDAISGSAANALALSAEAGHPFDGIVFHAGETAYYHADDHDIAFKPTPHFARWAPVPGPDHLLVFRPGRRPKLIRVVPEDYWYEAPADPKHPFLKTLDVVTVGSTEAAVKTAGDCARMAYVGPSAKMAAALGVPVEGVEPPALLAPLDWERAYKTPYEVFCIRAAAEIAARGHAAVRKGMKKGQSERELHARYLAASGLLEHELPYGNIIAWDAAASTLHYQSKRTGDPKPGHVLLIDAGGAFWGYASDITRTYAAKDAHPVFREILKGMDRMQLDLVSRVAPGKPFVELHAAAHRGVAAILEEAGVFKVSADEAYDAGMTRPFLPHGLGHHLGIQVHDVGGRQAAVTGGEVPAPPEHPYLRTTRDLDTGHVVTIEPGLYFIPMLLRPWREGKHAKAFSWRLIDTLTKLGGIRVEDDVLVTGKGRENLTRDLVP